MKVPRENICSFCEKIFCCPKCRAKHETSAHSTVSFDCNLCISEDDGKVMPEVIIKKETDQTYADHLIKKHLPLFCSKCGFVVNTPEDLDKVQNQCCKTVKQEKIPDKKDIEMELVPVTASESVKSVREVQTQTAVTPKMNFKWVQQSYSAGIDSYSLLRNASIIGANHSSKITSTKLIRTTSTPTQELMCMIQQANNHFMNNSSQVSSIYCQTSDMVSPSGQGFNITPMAPRIEGNFKIPFQKLKGRATSNATPLRQAVSRNIHQAFFKRDIKFLLTASPPVTVSSASPTSQPLDLRTSMAIRRKSEEDLCLGTELKCIATCEEDYIVKQEPIPFVYGTPRKRNQPSLQQEQSDDSDNEIFYTPENKTRRNYSGSQVRVSVMSVKTEVEEQLITQDLEEEYEEEYEQTETKENKINLWNVIASVFKFASFNLIRFDDNVGTQPASINNEIDENSTIKRRRHTIKTTPSKEICDFNSPPTKRSRIQGRRPIARMRPQ